MRQYATAAEFADFTARPAPADIDAVLRRASSVVDELLLTAVYDVDSDGLPTDTTVTEALRDATCAQASWFYATGDTTGADAQWSSMSLGSASLSRGSGQASTTPAASRYAPEAVQVLRGAGLLGHGVRSW